MSSTILLSDNGATSGISGYQLTGGTDGTLTIKTTTSGGTPTTAVSIDNTQNTTVAGNMTLSGTGKRITGDFSNATVANRVAFQTSTANGNTSVPFIPNGTGTVSGVLLYGGNDTTNTNFLQILSNGALNAGIAGTGSYQPMTFYTGGSERMRIDTSGNVGIGTSSPADKLEVAGAIRVSGSGSATADNAQFYNASGFGPTINGYNFAIRTGASTTSERMRIDSSGNVGIGLTPYYKLDVSGTSRYNVDTSGASVTLRAMNPAGSVNVNLYNNALSHTWQLSGGTNMALDQNGTFYVNSGFGSAGKAYACRAWVNFNGTGTVAIRASGNVSSITDNGTGSYTVNFTTAMPDANYAPAIAVGNVNGTAFRTSVLNFSATNTASACSLQTVNASFAVADENNINVAIFR